MDYKRSAELSTIWNKNLELIAKVWSCAEWSRPCARCCEGSTSQEIGSHRWNGIAIRSPCVVHRCWSFCIREVIELSKVPWWEVSFLAFLNRCNLFNPSMHLYKHRSRIQPNKTSIPQNYVYQHGHGFNLRPHSRSSCDRCFSRIVLSYNLIFYVSNFAGLGLICF